MTVTHPDIIRYFMTIPEAARLVLQAAAIGESGQVLVLDMGEPVRIVDLARDLIRLAGPRRQTRSRSSSPACGRGRSSTRSCWPMPTRRCRRRCRSLRMARLHGDPSCGSMRSSRRCAPARDSRRPRDASGPGRRCRGLRRAGVPSRSRAAVTAVFVNGKFCAQRTTGVQRYARCALEAIDALLASHRHTRAGRCCCRPARRCLRCGGCGYARSWRGPGRCTAGSSGRLPRAARGGLLLNLAGSAPAWARRRQLCVMHDAAMFDHPQAYTTAFAAGTAGCSAASLTDRRAAVHRVRLLARAPGGRAVGTAGAFHPAPGGASTSTP